MALVFKKINGRRYLYAAHREGGKVVHRYIGPEKSAAAVAFQKEDIESHEVPKKISPLFWDADVKKIDPRRQARYVIERVLELGDLDAVQWVQRIQPVRKILQVCRESRHLSEKSRAFWLLWFGHPA